MSAVGIDWDPAQDAICDWVEATSGLPLGHAYWADQDGVRSVAPPYVVMRLMGTRRIGQDQRRHEVNISDDTIAAIVEGPRVLRVALTCFSDEVLGVGQASSVLERILTGWQLPDVFEKLYAANVSIGPIDDIVPLAGIEAFQVRATAQLDVFVSSTMTALGYVIRKVEFTNETTGQTFTAPREPPP